MTHVLHTARTSDAERVKVLSEEMDSRRILKNKLDWRKKGVFKSIFFTAKPDLGEESSNESSSQCGVKKRKKDITLTPY